MNANLADVQLRWELAKAYDGLAAFLEKGVALDEAISVRSSAIDLLQDTRDTCGDSAVIRSYLATQLNGRGFTLREQDNLTEAEKDYREILVVLEDDYDAGTEVMSLLAMAHDGIGDIRDTLGDPDARDDAWERARVLFVTVLHELDREGIGSIITRKITGRLLQDVIDKQNEFR